MWIIFNPTENDLQYEIDFKKWQLLAGESKKFPNEIGKEMVNIHGFLQVIERDDIQPVKTYTPPKNLKTVKEAEPEELRRDRRLKHPTSDPRVVETEGFGPMSDEASGLPKTIATKVQSGKLMSIDKDGVGWYGGGAELDNPLAKD